MLRKSLAFPFFSFMRGGFTSTKSYLSSQIRLMTLSTYDLLTDEERTKYFEIAGYKRQLSEPLPKDQREAIVAQKRVAQDQLAALIAAHEHVPRAVNMAAVLMHEAPGVTWRMLKPTRRIAEFVSEESRCLGLQPNEITFDKIIVKWKSIDILRQIILNGFTMPILEEDGTVTEKHYRFSTASAGQLRTDKAQFISEEAWAKIERPIMCGLTWDKINEKGGINTSKVMAYLALPCSATDLYDLDIDRCIVVEDFEAPVTGMMDYIKPDYSIERGIQTVIINHCDGAGMMLPTVSKNNFMIRAPWLKGLLCSFDFIRFCSVNHCEPKLKDIWGQEHDLVQEDIQVIFTKSQLKLWKYYDSWQQYKDYFKACGCHFGRTNMEESYIQNSEMNYQFLQTLVDLPNKDLKELVKPTYDRIKTLSTDRDHMLHVLGADEYSEIPYRQALKLYPEMLREPYSRESLKAIKKRWTLDAKSGKLRCKNKRLFAIPDLYAACQFWFLGQTEPEGLLKDGQVYAKVFKDADELDILRSPHLYFEHAIRTNIANDQEISSWFYTNGIYTSCHDLISRILQFDVDGDQLNVVSDKIIINSAKLHIEKYDIVPLFYDATKAAAEIINPMSLFNGVKRAHDYSGIGQISNSLTRLWNRPKPDFQAAARLCYFNNLTIDGAKTGSVNSYDRYPEVAATINKAIGGQNGRMPYWFQFSKNGRRRDQNNKKKKCAKPNHSLMNRLCALFDDIGSINLNAVGVPPFNGEMLLEQPVELINQEAVDAFIDLDSSNLQTIIEGTSLLDIAERTNQSGYDVVKELIVEKLTELCGSIEAAYPSIAYTLFIGDYRDKAAHKQMFWRVFGNIALRNLSINLDTCVHCTHCGAKLPLWSENHRCLPQERGFFTCADCGKWCVRTNSRQCRCKECQAEYRRVSLNEHNRQYRKVKKETMP